MPKIDFNELEMRAAAFLKAQRYRDAMAVYYAMGDDDPSLDAGYLAHRIGQCHEAMGELHAARYWYGRAAEENPMQPRYIDARARLEPISFDGLPVAEAGAK